MLLIRLLVPALHKHTCAYLYILVHTYTCAYLCIPVHTCAYLPVRSWPKLMLCLLAKINQNFVAKHFDFDGS